MRWRFQFSIRSIFVLTFLVSLVYGWHAWQQAQFMKRGWRLHAFSQLGGTCDTRFFLPGEDAPADGEIDDPRWVFINLHMANSKITDKDLSLIEPLTTLELLDLRNTRITDAGLARLRRLRRLRRLDLVGTAVTDAGVEELQRCLPNCKIDRVEDHAPR